MPERRVLECDRCGKWEDVPASTIKSYNLGELNVPLILCQECRDSLSATFGKWLGENGRGPIQISMEGKTTNGKPQNVSRCPEDIFYTKLPPISILTGNNQEAEK
jgi:hypothetical protein